MRTNSPLTTTWKVNATCLTLVFPAFTGNGGVWPGMVHRLRQVSWIGHASHEGDFGVQTSAPNSMTAWLCIPGSLVFRKACANASIGFLPAGLSIGSAIPAHRLITRSALPSTAAVGSPKQMEAMAAAVYGPTPGSACQPFAVFGNSSFHSWATTCAALCKFRALL